MLKPVGAATKRERDSFLDVLAVTECQNDDLEVISSPYPLSVTQRVRYVMLSSRRFPIIFLVASFWANNVSEVRINDNQNRKKARYTLSPGDHGRNEDVFSSVMPMVKNDESCVSRMVGVEAQ